MSVDAPTAQIVTTELGEGRSRQRNELVRGSMFGRFVVTGSLGAGGAGSVFAAYDPELDRRVALKMLHGDADERGDPTDQWRQVVREARALARLSHPNVVVVHDVGVEGGRPWLATELVDGTDLRQWLAARPDLRHEEILALFEGAGRGLAAAHAAGLVHGDFKPANVLVGADGRPRVADFGLARLAAVSVVPSSSATGDGTQEASSKIVGTPYYMAPEQLTGLQADARADQYAFSLALLEAVLRRKIYDTPSISKLLLEKLQPIPGATLIALPRWLRPIIERGVAPSAVDRHPSMDALLDAIERSRAQRRRVGWFLGITGAMGLGAAATYAATVDRGDEVCGGSDRHVAASWNDARRTALSSAFMGAHSVGEATAKRVIAQLDAYGERWVAAHRTVCLAGHHREQSVEIVAARTACLDDRLDGLVALVERLTEADGETVLRADAATRDLPDLERCDDIDVVVREFGGGEPGDPAEIAAAEQHLRRMDAALHLAQHERAHEALVAVEALDVTATVERLRLAAAVRRGELHCERGEFDDARRVLEPAILAAVAADHDDTALRGMSPLLQTLGPVMLAFDDAAAWSRWGDPIAVRGRAPATLHARVLEAAAMVDATRGDAPAAQAKLERAIELLSRAHAPAIDAAKIELRLAEVRSMLGRQVEAAQAAEHARSVIAEAVGVAHPDHAAATGILGLITWRRGDRSGRDLVVQAVRDLEAAYEPDHLALAPALNNLAAVMSQAGEHAAAREVLTRSLAIERRRFGADHIVTGPTLVNLGTFALWMDDPAGGLAELSEAERVFAANDADRPELGGVLRQKSYALAELGRVTEAVAAANRAVELIDRHRAHDNAARADVRLQQGWVRLLARDHVGAKQAYDEAVAFVDTSDDPLPRDRAAMLAEILRGRADVHDALGTADLAAADRARAASLVDAPR